MAPTITVGLDELELIVRRALRKELAQFVTQRRYSILHDLDQEGPEDDVADEALAAEALAVLERYRKDRTGWQKWEDFEDDEAQVIVILRVEKKQSIHYEGLEFMG